MRMPEWGCCFERSDIHRGVEAAEIGTCGAAGAARPPPHAGLGLWAARLHHRSVRPGGWPPPCAPGRGGRAGRPGASPGRGGAGRGRGEAPAYADLRARLSACGLPVRLKRGFFLPACGSKRYLRWIRFERARCIVCHAVTCLS
uniref:Uncharacterized protein n=1 Tax=Oryza sativa subsp. japonica TaxID=39947 RepID=Q8LHW5_ORYSJ|nr:hypothetical protein [Oryza sativa Japonica Group]BAD30952.1 hypothetical protein [Oryza sativa Japonica Group]